MSALLTCFLRQLSVSRSTSTLSQTDNRGMQQKRIKRLDSKELI